ncbi:MAG: hypothetical protein RLZZ58_1774 [Pseudomonadota bacterium]
MHKAIQRFAIILACVSVGGVPVTAAKSAKSAASVKVAVADMVAARQAAMLMSAANLGSIKALIDSGAGADKLGFPVAGLASWASALTGLFPKGSASSNSRALPAVWSDWVGFAAEGQKYSDAAKGLQAAVKGGDKAAISAAFDGVRGSCKSCHDKYQAPPPAMPAVK